MTGQCTTADPDQGAARKVDTAARFVCILLILGILWWLTAAIRDARVPPAPPPAPLPFQEVEERYRKLTSLWWRAGNRADVHRLLGPPTYGIWNDPAIRAVERAWEHTDRHSIPRPENRVWDKWVDPDNSGRWVIVLSSGYPSYRVHRSEKNGF